MCKLSRDRRRGLGIFRASRRTSRRFTSYCCLGLPHGSNAAPWLFTARHLCLSYGGSFGKSRFFLRQPSRPHSSPVLRRWHRRRPCRHGLKPAHRPISPKSRSIAAGIVTMFAVIAIAAPTALFAVIASGTGVEFILAAPLLIDEKAAPVERLLSERDRTIAITPSPVG